MFVHEPCGQNTAADGIGKDQYLDLILPNHVLQFIPDFSGMVGSVLQARICPHTITFRYARECFDFPVMMPLITVHSPFEQGGDLFL